MGYRDGYEATETEEESDYAKEKEVARKTWGGWLMVAALLLGLVFVLVTGQSLTTKGETVNAYGAAGIVIEAAVAAFLAWRVHIGKGWIAGSLLLALWVLEIVAKITGGPLNAGWILVHIAAMANLFLGVRACWRLRTLTPDPAELEV